ncbi:transporter substrate-binding domain-containing protein [Amycolatopsis carbonis]|uniref:Transporter substrate-binding domain-containing protein n=1 Tax=Amycolatopsis carbonis TaxID=715471 RepID=A0A9Y2IKU7_9PSEU|nr:transporter substrate-binding domain-containing protein [Amycolatopsis sp. 2-15]WIX81647.1 transporter substrate-binding domain-containing protein [Amycolatopsis sp. 2-15]
MSNQAEEVAVRIPTRVVAALAAAVLAAGCSASTSAAPPPLKVCTTGDYQPLTYRDPATGHYTGIDIDMARDLATHLGRAATFVPTTWATLMPDLVKCDIAMGGISVTPARRQQADFTAPYLANGKTPLTTTAHAAEFQTVAQINTRGTRVLEDTGGTNLAFAQQRLPDATLVVSSDNTKCFAQLLAGHADVMITDAIEAEYQARKNPGLVAVHPDQPFTSDHKAYLLPKGSPLTARVNEWLNAALQNGTFTRFYQQALS